jgi:oligopeptide/dipeptide ABC transporter ATP-binding protein
MTSMQNQVPSSAAATGAPSGTPVLEGVDLRVEIPLPSGTLHAVRGVSFGVSAGEAVGLVGESGSGKSITLRALLGLLPTPARVTGGALLLDGVDVLGMPAAAQQRALTDAVSMVFQDSLTALNPVMRVGDQVAEVPRRRLGMSKAAARARAIELMDQVGIPDPELRYRAYPHQLSGGMRQRICIAIALSTDPRVILADEPTTALDVTIQAQVLQLIDRLRVERNLGLVLVSHDLAVVSQTCSRIFVMYGGRMVETGPSAGLLGEPQHPYTYALLRSVPDPDAPAERLLTIAGQPPSLVDVPPGCAYAPRCAFARDVCTARPEPPDLVTTLPGHANACVRWHEIDLRQTPELTEERA